MGAPSVVVTTYDSPRTLRLVLLALARQTLKPAVVAVADDGSGPDTAAMLRQAALAMPFPIVHVWQPDDGFRLARSRNNAWRELPEGRVAMLDQDIIPHAGWLEAHAAPGKGRVGLGAAMDLPESAVVEITEDAVTFGRFESILAPGEMGRLRKLRRKCVLQAFLRAVGLAHRAKPKLRGCNFSADLSDLRAVNGCDEEFVGWGQEDDDLGMRLYMAGARPAILVDSALASHLWHPSRATGRWKDGPNVRRFQRRDIAARCERGMDGARPDVKVFRYPSGQP